MRGGSKYTFIIKGVPASPWHQRQIDPYHISMTYEEVNRNECGECEEVK